MSKGNRTKGPRQGRPRLSPADSRRMVSIRLHPYSIAARNELARLWACDRTRAVEEALAICEGLHLAGHLPPRVHRPALDGARK
jgi:hypothetical protein